MKPDSGQVAVAHPRVRLRVLIVEDSEDDALLILRELERGGYEPVHERVDTPEAMRGSLAEGGPWDVVLSDWQMPRFEAPEALAMFRATGSEAPFIIVSGKVGEEVAVEAMKAGAHDYVMKGNLTRLCATVERGLEEAEARREREQAEKSLKESEERFRSLVMNSSDMITVFGADGSRIYTSPSIERVLGYRPENMLGGSAFDLVHPDDVRRVREEFAERARTPGTGRPFELRLRHADGSWRVFESIGANLLDDPSVGGLIFNARDVTDRKRAEEALKESEERYRRLVELSPNMIVVHGGGEVLFANTAGAKLFGAASAEELIGKPVMEFVHPDYQEIVRARIARVEQKGERADLIEEKFLRLDGRAVDVEVTSTPIIYRDEAATLTVIRDITARKRAEEGLRRREAILRAVAFAAECFLKKTSSWEESIEEVLEQLGRDAEVSRVYIFENYWGEDGERWATQRYEWVAPGVSVQIDNPSLDAFPYRAAGWRRWERTLGRGQALHGHVREFPEAERLVLRAQEIESILAMPIFVEGDWWGTIGFDECFAEREWYAAEIDALKAAADTMGAAIGRTRAERALRESEERFRATFEQAAVGVAHVAFDGSWLRVNQKLCEIVGYTREELLERTFQDITHPDDLKTDLEHLDRLRTGEISRYSMEKRYFRKAGSMVWIELTVSLVRAASGEPEYFIAIVEDITERIRSAEALVQSEERYRAVVEQAAESIFLFEAATGDILEYNAAFQELLSYTTEEILSMKIYDLVAHDRESIDSNIRLILNEGRRSVGERRYRRRDGSLVDVEVTASLIYYRGRRVICTVVRDVSERVEAFRLLEERVTALVRIAASLTVDQTMEANLDALAARVVGSTAAVACSVVLLNTESGLPHTAGSHGLPEGYTVGMQAAYKTGLRPAAMEAFRTHKPILVRDIRLVALEQSLASSVHRFLREAPWDTIYCVPLVSRGLALGTLNLYYPADEEPGENERVFLSAVADQTAVVVENTRLFDEAQGKAALEERQRLARELHDSVSQALYGIALGSRTASTLLAREAHPDRVAEWLEYVLSLAEAGLTEMRALIFELRPESLETEGLITALNQQAAALEARHELPVHTTLCEEPDLPLETKEALYRIAQEALHNTVKHAHASKAELKLECDSEGIALEVSDDGVGFDPEGTFSGHLGLKSMRERATRLGGTLRVESTPGEGTTVRVRTILDA
ncbi:MAG TPA: PAS domain S-box protein [Rubrobacteraceae bacterium]